MAQAAGFSGRVSQSIAASLEGFRAQDRFFKAQAAIVGAWLLLSIATLAIIGWTGRSENKLGADVRTEAAIGGTMVLITNSSTEAWTDITYTLNGVYLAREAALSPGDHVAMPLKRFRKGGAAGKRAPRALVPQTLLIRCEQGQFETSLSVIAGAAAP